MRRSLLARVTAKLRRAVGGTPTEAAFGPRTAEIWAELREQYALGYQTIGAAMVASWEVAASELNAAARPLHGARTAELVTRFSDALVPTLSAVQAAERTTGAAWDDSTRAAAAAGRLAAGLAPLIAHSAGLGSEVAAGWPKSVAHLEPVLDALRVRPEGCARLDAVALALRAAIDTRAADLAVALRRVPVAENVESAFLDAIEKWRHATAQDVEVALDQVRAVLVEAARAEPPTAVG